MNNSKQTELLKEALVIALRLIYKAEVGNCALYTQDIQEIERLYTEAKREGIKSQLGTL